MTIVYEVYQGISAYRAMNVHAQVPKCPRPMEGTGQCIFEALFEQVHMSAAFYYKPQTGYKDVYETVCTPLVR